MIAAVSMVKDEADVIRPVVLHMLGEGCDLVLVADNLSTDGTRDILADLEREYNEVVIEDDRERAYYQSRKMTALASRAAVRGAEWIIPFDADEIWYCPTGETLAEHVTASSAGVINCPVYRHVPRPWDDPTELHPFLAMRHREPHPEKMRVACYRFHPAAVIRLGNHGIDFHPGRHVSTGIEVRHFQYRSWPQFQRKLRNGREAMDATDLSRWEGEHWRRMGAMSDEELRGEWENLLSLPTVLDPAPLRSVSSRSPSGIVS